uniref:ASPSCR1 tether for SLC2A4, UBX domain containing n=1 Tax=Ailuropoda melanoleuca TaxID=9646 RepID=A0A7N5P0U1_AILME
MVPISRSRQGPENTVRIALQLDDGTRLQDTFCSGQTLWELLSHFAQTRKRPRASGVLFLAGSCRRGARPPRPTVGQVAAPLHGGPALTTSIWIN